MDVMSFIDKWSKVELSERAASQEHFIDLCHLLGQPTPAGHDATGAEYTFEKGVAVTSGASAGAKGERGFADVWWRGKFGWEYKRKGKHKDLRDAYRQLQQYREALENPPLLIVCDIARIEIHTNFTGFRSDVHVIELEELHEPGRLELLRRVFTEPESFKPAQTAEQVTEEAAKEIGRIAQGLRDRGHDPHLAAHFLMKTMFCLFAEDVNLLPKNLFQKLLSNSKGDPARLKKQMDMLFSAMREGGDFGVDEIAYFNGGLFDEGEALELTNDEIETLIRAAGQDWGAVEPSVFGTLFERSLDPNKRAQIGAHYTSRDDIMLVIEPVIVRPLRREWDACREAIEKQLERRRSAKTAATKRKADDAITKLLLDFQARLASVRVLDPACGSGNFLYVAIQQLLALEKEVILHASGAELGVGGLLPQVRPTQLFGIEINPYAAELAQVVIWIGYLQWMRDNGFNAPRNPILEPIQTIENRDAILKWEDADGAELTAWEEGAVCAGKAAWPEAEFIVGNPPFLGASLLRENLGHSYTEAMFASFDLPKTSDLCCYWLEIARRKLKREDCHCGLLATQGVRGQHNFEVLKRIGDDAQIFEAWADRNWLLEGAAVHVSIICFARHGSREDVHLDGRRVPLITRRLSASADVSLARVLNDNEGRASRGNEKGGAFDIQWPEARQMLAQPNPNGRPNVDVLRPYSNGQDITRRSKAKWLVDFGVKTPLEQAAQYEAPMAHVVEYVKPERDKNRREAVRKYWWLHRGAWPVLRDGIRDLHRFIVIPHVAKHFLVSWLFRPQLPDHQLIAIFLEDDCCFGVLHSSVHELWARRQGTQLREAESGFRYTPTTCFETFPLPWPPGQEPGEGEAERELQDAIAEAARSLNEQRERWLNPPEWIAEIAEQVDREDDFADVARVSGEEARRLIRQSAIDAAAAEHKQLRKRTLTNLYNERPTWLRLAHRKLDEAVLAAYAAVDPEGGWDADWARVFGDTGAGQPLPQPDDGSDHPLAAERANVEEAILGALLRLNQERAG